MVLRRLAVLFVVWGWLGVASVHAAVSYDSALTWRTLYSANFRIHYHNGLETLARRAAAHAERVHTNLVPVIGWTPSEPTDIVLSDRIDVSNAYASVFPYNRLVIYLSTPDEVEGLEDHGGWLDTVLTHEYVHILHLDKAERAPSVLRKVFGRNILLFPNALQPRWLIEGLATWHETDRERGIGRGQSSYFNMLMRGEVAEGIKPIHQINQPIASWPGGVTPYLYGVAFFNYIEHQHGEARIGRLIDHYSDNIIPFRINSNSRQVLGDELDRVWPRFESYLQTQHEPRLREIRAAGVVAGERLTEDGYLTGAARGLPDGSVVYLRVDARREPALLRRFPDGQVRHLTDAHVGAHFTLHPQAGILLAQPEVHRNASFFYDLYRVDLERGALRRLTHGARYRYGVWSPDGTRIVAVRNDGGQHALHLLDAAGQQLAVLWDGQPDVVFADPVWSPDGTSVVLAASRPSSGWNLERFHINERRFEMLTRDAAIESQPSFSPDGRTLLFSSDHGGVYNLRRMDLATGQVTTLSNVEGGAFHPVQAQANGPVYYTGYHAGGFDLYRLSQPASLPLPAAAPGPSAKYVDDPPIPADLREGGYSPYSGLRPRWWLPHIAIDSQRTELGAITSAWDPLLRHLYYLDAAYDFRNQWPVGSFDYIYDRFYPVFKLHASRYSHLFLDQNDDPARVTTSDTYLGEMVLPFLRYRRNFNVHAAAYTVRDADGWTAPGVTPVNDRTDNVLGYALVYNSARRYPLSISRSNGLHLSASAETSDGLKGSDYSGEVYTLDGRAFIPLGREHVLAARVVYGWGTGRPRPFVLGGSDSSGEVPLPIDFSVVNSPFNQRNFALRGYDSGLPELTGRRMTSATLEWRFPLRRIERGFMVPPVAIHQLHGNLFAETGAAWNAGRHPDKYFTAAGVEALADVFLFYDLGLQLRLGYAYGFANRGDHHVYLRLGASF